MRDHETWHRVVRYDGMQNGDMMSVSFGDTLVALYRVDDEFFATSNICTHAFAILSDGWLEADVIECPLHGGRFNVRTGKALCDPVDCDLKTFPVRVVNGYVEILTPEDP